MSLFGIPESIMLLSCYVMEFWD